MKNIRTNRSGLFLIEMVIVILFFSITAAICVRLFAAAATTSRNSAELSAATLACESAAETIHACDGNAEEFSAALGAEQSGNSYAVCYDKEREPVTAGSGEKAVYTLAIVPSAAENGVTDFLISFSRNSDGGQIYSLTTAVFTGKGAA